MVNEIRELLREAASAPPTEGNDLGAVLRSGRARVRRRRAGVVTCVAAAMVVALGVGTWLQSGGGADGDRVASQTVPMPDGPVQRLSEAGVAVEGEDYDVLASHTNEDLNASNGEYYDGVTDDGLILLRDGPHGPESRVRLALVDPATGARDWLPDHQTGSQPRPVLLADDQLVLVGSDNARGDRLRAVSFDRTTRTWTDLRWPTLGKVDPFSAEIAPDGRLYVGVPATSGAPPPGGWPTTADGDADDAGAEGDTHDLWSVSLTDPADVRDEGLRVGEFAFTEGALVWSARTNGTNDRIHVRDLASGAEHDFDPRSGERCNLLGFSASGDRIVLSQYCGTYDDGRDDRVQVLSTDGELVTTIQGDGISGWIGDNGDADGHLVQLTSYLAATEGHYVLDLDTGRMVRATTSVSSWALGGPTPAGHLMWDTSYGRNADRNQPDDGATQTLVRWR